MRLLTDADNVLEFSRLDSDPTTLVALGSDGDRVVVAIVHTDRPEGDPYRWSLAGDVDAANRPKGTAPTAAAAMGEAGKALGEVLGLPVAGVTFVVVGS